MLHFLPAPLRGLLAGLMLALNTLICCWPLFAVALLKLLLPIPAIQRGLRFVMHGIAEFWISAVGHSQRLSPCLATRKPPRIPPTSRKMVPTVP